MLKIILVSFLLCASSVLASPVPHQHNGREHSYELPREGLQHQHNQKTNNSKTQTQLFIKTIYNKKNTVNSKGQYGKYNKDSLKVLWLNNGRKAKLLETLTFKEPNGREWVAPKGHIIDGASIPAPFQPIVGTPYGGKYVMASVIHDVGCDEKKSSWQDVHNVFHLAMLASGVSKEKAKLMYEAVYLAGPRWGKDSEKKLTEEEFKKLINNGKFKKLSNDFGVDELDIDLLSTWGKLKAYEGTLIYSGLRDEKSVAGLVAKKNDFHTSVEIGNGKPKIDIGYTYHGNSSGTSKTPNDFNIHSGLRNHCNNKNPSEKNHNECPYSFFLQYDTGGTKYMGYEDQAFILLREKNALTKDNR